MPAWSAGVAEQIRAEGVLRCGAVERPGVAEVLWGGPAGVVVDLCRAVAVAVLGPKARVSFSLYHSPRGYDGSREGLGFLTGSEIAEQGVGGAVLPGPGVFINAIGVMAPEASGMRALAGLAGQTVCVMIGSWAQRALESAAARLHLTISRLGFEEDVEMLDVYNAGRCAAAVGEAGYLAGMRLNPGVRGVKSALLREPLAADPIIAVTPRGDGAWGAAVAWVIRAVMLAGEPADPWAADGLPVARPDGLRAGWRADVTAAVGSYGEIVRRNVTDRLGLAAGPNALWPAGMLLPPAVR